MYAAQWSLEEVGVQLYSYPGVATSFFFFFLFSFLLFILTADPVSFARSLLKRISSFKPYVKITNLGAGRSIFCATERDVSLLFVRSTAAIPTNNTQALLHV